MGTRLVDGSLTLTLLGIGVTYQIQAGTLLNSCGFMPVTSFNQKIWTLVSALSECEPSVNSEWSYNTCSVSLLLKKAKVRQLSC
jgi:hypothetical protein